MAVISAPPSPVAPSGRAGLRLDAGEQARTVLVLRALGLGDMLTAVPALRALRRAHPTHRLVLLAPRRFAGLAAAAGVDLTVDHAGLDPVGRQWSAPAVAVNLHGRGPESSMLLDALEPRRLISFRHPSLLTTWDGPAWWTHEHETARWCRLLRHHGVAADPSDLHLSPPLEPSPVPPGTVIVHPGARAAGRRWPAERFAAAVRRLADDGHLVALVGDDSEVPLCEEVARQAGRGAVVIAGRTTLDQVAAAVSEARLVLCNDSGIAHLASAFATPSVVLFGPSSPADWGPPVDGPHVVLWRGRTGDARSEVLDPGLAQISVREVMAAAQEAMSTDAPRPVAETRRPAGVDR